METLSLIDVSAEDDLFLGLASPPAMPQPPDRDPPSAGFRAGAAADLVPTGAFPAAASRAPDTNGVTEDQVALELAESPKQRKAKTGVNLRKSLAWDSAFFTSEGVLDTEELAIVNSTFRKTRGARLPGITEESRRSGESTTSTALDSESWEMESIETELFDNVRASIQKSFGKPNKVTTVPPASSKPPRAAANAPCVAGRKVVDQIPQIKMRAPVSTSQGVGAKQRPQAALNKSTATRVTQTEDKEAKPSSRPPRALPRVATMSSSTKTAIASGISDKRSSTGGVGNRQAVGKSANTSGGVRPGGVTKSSSVPKTGALIPPTTKPDTKNKPATLSSTKRTAHRIPIRSSSKSDCTKPNTTRSSGNKILPRDHNNRALPTISPNSSIDSMSSVISGTSTASTVGKMSHTSESFSSLSASLSPSLRKSNDHPLTAKLRPPVFTEGQYSGTAASGDSLIASAGTIDKGKASKPSGLRRPTPKMGYFDAGKSTEQRQPTKIQQLLPATSKSEPSSTHMESAAASSFGQQEPKSTAPPEESGATKSRAMMALSIKGAQMDAVPFNVSEPEVCTLQTGPVVAQPKAAFHQEKSIDHSVSGQVQQQPMEIKCPLLATPNSQQYSMQTMILASPISATAASHEDMNASTSKAVIAVPLKVAQIELELSQVAQMETIVSTSEAVQVAKSEACSYETSPVVAEYEAEQSNDWNIGEQVQPMKGQLSLPGTPNYELSSTQTTNPGASTLDQQDSRPTEAPHEAITALKSKAEKFAKAGEPFHVADLNVVRTEVFKVAENEALVHQANPLVTTAEASKENVPALDQNMQANDDSSSLSVELLIQKLSSISLVPAPDMTS